MKKLAFILLFLSLINSIYSQELKKFELGYNISGWYEHNAVGSIVENTYYINNNLKTGYNLTSFISLGLSTNFFNNYFKEKHGFIYTSTIKYYEGANVKQFEIGTGPYAKVAIGKNFRFFLTVEYNFSYGLFISKQYNEWVEYNGWDNSSTNFTYKNKYITHYLASEIGVGKRLSNCLFLNLFVRRQYTFIYKLLPVNPNMTFTPSFQTYIGFGLAFNFNLIKNEK
jgi:hypothetical protein